MAAPPTKRPRSSSTAAAEAAKEKSWFPTFANVPEPKVVQKPVRCCNECGREGHTLRNCTRTSDHGDLMGCPWCETIVHLPEACPKLAASSLTGEDIYEGIVLTRIGKCQWRTHDGRYTFVHQTQQRHKVRPHGLPCMFYPHTREFALQQRALNPTPGALMTTTKSHSIWSPTPGPTVWRRFLPTLVRHTSSSCRLSVLDGQPRRPSISNKLKKSPTPIHEVCQGKEFQELIQRKLRSLIRKLRVTFIRTKLTNTMP